MKLAAAFTPAATRRTTRVLPGDTTAFEHAGALSQLLRGAELEVIGEGFSDRTVEVVSKGITYFIFLRDLEDGADYPRVILRPQMVSSGL
jgi:hypothetical protein